MKYQPYSAIQTIGRDLKTKAKLIASRTYDPIGTYLAVAVIYLLLVFILSEGLKFLERRLRIPGLETV